MSNSKNQPNNRISEDVNLSSMTKELREDVDRIIRDVNMTAGSRVDEILALFHRYAAEREKQARIEEVTRIRKRVGGSTVATNEYRAWLDERISALKEPTNE